MNKGRIGTRMGGSIEYRYGLKPTTRNCRNCAYYKRSYDHVSDKPKYGYCREFSILITDCTNARLCKKFQNTHGNKGSSCNCQPK